MMFPGHMMMMGSGGGAPMLVHDPFGGMGLVMGGGGGGGLGHHMLVHDPFCGGGGAVMMMGHHHPGMIMGHHHQQHDLVQAVVNCGRCGRSSVQLMSTASTVRCPHCGHSKGSSVLEHLTGTDGTTAQVDGASREQRLCNGDTRRLYHQTSHENANLILASQRMNRGSTGLCGGGIYFAESAYETNAKAHSKGVVLEATVRLGRPKSVDSGDSNITFSALLQQGYDSVISRRSTGTEYVVYNHDQVSNIRRVS